MNVLHYILSIMKRTTHTAADAPGAPAEEETVTLAVQSTDKHWQMVWALLEANGVRAPSRHLAQGALWVVPLHAADTVADQVRGTLRGLPVRIMVSFGGGKRAA